jgi:two-component system probable response regulator PhcQ
MPYTVLIVDDQTVIRELLEEALTRERYNIFSAPSAEAALKIIDSQPVDVVITDEKMPGMQGTQFLGIVRRRHPDTIRIVLTGHASLETAIRAINEGEIYRFFTKPCNIVDLMVTVRQGLEQRELQRENRRLRQLVDRQANTLEALEKQCPGITDVKRDIDGTVIIDLDE